MSPETPKGVSSRLLTMKFMQRAAATASSTGSPDADAPSAKKRKLDHSPAEGRISMNVDQLAVKAALDEQEATRQAALKRHATEDTHWVLNTTLDSSKEAKSVATPFRVVYVGYGDADSGNDSDIEDAPMRGRTSTHNHRPSAKEKSATANRAESDDDASDRSSDEGDTSRSSRKRRQSDLDTPSSSAQERSRSRSKSKRAGAVSGANELRNKRKKKEVRLNQLTSISSAGDSSRAPSRSNKPKASKKP